MRLHVGKRSWLINHTIGRLEEELDPARFVRLHRSAIVRRDFVTGLRRDEGGRWWARLADGERAEGRPALSRQRQGARRTLSVRLGIGRVVERGLRREVPDLGMRQDRDPAPHVEALAQRRGPGA